MDAREKVLNDLYKRCGFEFDESELSPKNRSKIGQLAENFAKMVALESEIKSIEGKTSRSLAAALLFLMIGGSLICAGVGGIGIFLLLISGLIWRRFFSAGKKLKSLRNQIDLMCKKQEEDCEQLSKEIYNELSEVYEQKVRPKITHFKIDFAAILQATKGKRAILESIECPFCSAKLTLPRSGDSVKCEACGKTVLATDVFEQVKELIGLKSNVGR